MLLVNYPEPTDFQCEVCGEPGVATATMPAALTVYNAGGATLLFLTHSRCSGPKVITDPSERPRMADQEADSLAFSVTDLRPDGTARAWLLIQYDYTVIANSNGKSPGLDALAGLVLESGGGLVTSLTVDPEPGPRKWFVREDGPNLPGRISCDFITHDPLPAVGPEWLAAANVDMKVAVALVPNHTLGNDEDQTARIDKALSRGACVGALVRYIPGR